MRECSGMCGNVHRGGKVRNEPKGPQTAEGTVRSFGVGGLRHAAPDVAAGAASENFRRLPISAENRDAVSHRRGWAVSRSNAEVETTKARRTPSSSFYSRSIELLAPGNVELGSTAWCASCLGGSIALIELSPPIPIIAARVFSPNRSSGITQAELRKCPLARPSRLPTAS